MNSIPSIRENFGKVRKKSVKKIIFSFLLLGWISPAYAMGVVSLEGKAIPQLQGEKVETIQIYRVGSGGYLETIPFQVDEKRGDFTGARRTWAFDQDSGKLAANGIFEADEVLLWALKDAGPKFHSQSSTENFRKIFEVALNEARDSYIYITVSDRTAPKNQLSYLKYDAAKDQISAKGYEIAFNKKYPLVQEVLKIKNASLPYDILDRFKARFFLDIKNFFNFKFDEQKIKAKVMGTRVGPIRVIRRVQASKSLGPIKLIPKSKIDFYFYPYWFNVATEINNPVDGAKMLNPKTQGLSGFDFNNYVLGSDLRTNLGGISLRLDGKNSGGLEKISGENLRWWSLSGVSGSMVQSIRNDPQLSKYGIHPYLILINDSTRKNPPESEVGEVFIGFDMPYHKIPKGNYAIEVKQVFPEEFMPGKEVRFLQEALLWKPQQIERIR